MTEPDDRIAIEVALATPARQKLVALKLPAGSTVREALETSGIAASFPDIDVQSAELGIWSKLVTIDTVLRDGDRVELYRALKLDPREARRQLALVGETMGSSATD